MSQENLVQFAKDCIKFQLNPVDYLEICKLHKRCFKAGEKRTNGDLPIEKLHILQEKFEKLVESKTTWKVLDWDLAAQIVDKDGYAVYIFNL